MSELRDALPMPRDWVDVLAFRVAEGAGRLPVDVRCPCGQRMTFPHVYLPDAIGKRWSAASVNGLCPGCRQPIRVEVRIDVSAVLIAPQPHAKDGDE